MLLVVLLDLQYCPGQGLIGQNQVASFTRNQYLAGTQNWSITQDRNSRLYFANNEGLLVYNGTNWQLYPVPNKTIVRSLGFAPDGKLYAGAQDELGYYAPDKVGRLCFTSLKQLLPEKDKTFTDVWQIEVSGGAVFYRTDNKIFRFLNHKVDVYPSNSGWLSIHKHQEKVLAHERNVGLMIFQNNQWQPFIPKEVLPANFFITDIVPYQHDSSLVSTTSNGLYLLTGSKLIPFTIQLTGFNKNQHFTCLSMLHDNSFLAGTYFNGIYRISKQGIVLENISTKNGMPNNTVRCLFADSSSYAWAGLDNGLASFTYNNSIKQINPAAFNNGAGYDVKALNGNLYFALSTGLLSLPIQSETDISTITTSPRTILGGLTWNLSIINKQLFAGRDDGLFTVNNNTANPISQSIGYWGSRSLSPVGPLLIAAGNYFGIHFFEVVGNDLNDIGRLENFIESSRYLETGANCIWVSHPYRGVYRISLPDKSVQLFTEKDGLPAQLDNHVFKINNKIVFATSNGVYEYDSVSKKIQKAKEYEPIFGNLPIRYLKEDSLGNIWFVQEKMTGVVDYSSKKPVLYYISELKNKILSGFENIFPYNSRNILVGGETGFYHINYEKYRENIKPFKAYVTNVKTTAGGDSTLFGGYIFDSTEFHKPITISYKLNSLLFSYTASAYSQHNPSEFSYYLQGFDKGWSNWSNNTQKEYTNLSAGTYTFFIKARRSPSHESSVYQFTFTINPPWYQTIWAYFLYFILIAGSLYAILKYQSRRHQKKQDARRLADKLKFEEEQKQMAYQHQLELAKSEKELIHLQNEKLEVEIRHKNAELANATMNLVQKKEFILKLKAELQQLQKNSKVNDDNPELKKLLKVLSEEEKLDAEWNSFSQHFNSVHGNFLTTLKNKFPTLKPHELRLCAYLRMNLSSKEIAPLMSISIRGVEISRYRLRKKLALPTETNLVQFLMDIK